MASTTKEHAEAYQEQWDSKKERHPLPWIQRYLEMADLLIRRVKPPFGQREKAKPSAASDAIRAPKKPNRI